MYVWKEYEHTGHFYHVFNHKIKFKSAAATVLQPLQRHLYDERSNFSRK